MTGIPPRDLSLRRTRWILVAVVVLQAVLAAVLLESLSRIHDWGVVYGEDSYGYIQVARHFQGKVADPEGHPILRYRLFGPVIPALAALLGRAVGVETAFVALNLLFWILAPLVFHGVLRRWEGEREAWAGAVMLATALPFIQWGLPAMLDASAYLLAATSLWLYARHRDQGAWTAPLLGTTGALAVLVKPTLASLGGFFVLARLRDRRLAQAVMIGTFLVAFPLAVYWAIGLTPEDFFAFGTPRHRGLFYLASAAFFCFHWGWWLAWRGWRLGGREDRTYALYCVSFLVFFLPFVHSPRLFFLAFPAILALAARGAAELERQRGRPLVGWLLAAWVLTSNLLTALHLYIMRTLEIRSLEELRQTVGW